MNKIEPIDEDQDYHDAESTSEAAAHYKDDDGSIENGNMDDTDKETIESKPNLSSLNIGGADGDKGIVHLEKKRRESDEACNANDSNLNETEANDRDDIDSKLALATTSTQNGKKNS